MSDYYFYDSENARSKAHAAKLMSEENGIAYASPYGHRTYTNIDTRTSIRPEFGRTDYDYFRPGEAVPERPHDILRACDRVYWNVGIVKNIIDLMADFACCGVSIEHPSEQVEHQLKLWFRKVKGTERSERFLNTFYRLGNVIVQRHYGRLDNGAGAKIPYAYMIHNPMSLHVIGGDMATYCSGNYHYELELPGTLVTLLRKEAVYLTDEERKAVSEVDPVIRKAVIEGKNRIQLNSDDLHVSHYKKDDWQVWARPFIHSILEDVILLQKTKLCDMAALDGAISSVRLWNLGDLEHKLAPAPGAANRLARMLENNVGGGTIDIIWGPDLKMTESKSDIYQFLGEGKYKATLQNIYAGLGIPPTLTGNGGGGFTNNYISIKTLVERLEYGRNALRTFWEDELQIVQDKMGFDGKAIIRFDRMTLSDEAAEKALLVQLLDRQVISNETVLERFGELPTLEKERIYIEETLRNEGSVPPKASPFHDPQTEHEIEKIELQSKLQGEDYKPVGEPGRPKNSKDSKQRKRREPKPRTSVKGK